MSSRRKNTKPQAIRDVPEQLPRRADTASDLNSPTSKMKESANSVSAANHSEATTSIVNSINTTVSFDDPAMPELSIERRESESDCPLKIDTQFDCKHDSTSRMNEPEPVHSPNVSIGSEVSLNETGEFDDADDCNDPKRKCREETKIHPYERKGHIEYFRCPLCHADSIESRKNLTNHLRLHQNKEKRDDGKHLCCLCSHELSSNSSLERHLLTHTNFRPFTCKYCSKSFTTNGNLSRHIKTTHTGNSPVDNISMENIPESPIQPHKVARKIKSQKKSTPSEPAQLSSSMKEDMFESRNVPVTLSGRSSKEIQKSDLDMLTSTSNSTPAPLVPPLPATTLPGQHSSYFPNLPTSGPGPFPHYLNNKALTNQLASIYCQNQMQNSQSRPKFPFYCMGAPPHPTINPLFPSIFMPGQNLDSLVRLPNHSDFGVIIPPPMTFMPMQQAQQKLSDIDPINPSSLNSSTSLLSKPGSIKKQRERKQRKSSVALNNPPKSKKMKPDLLKLSNDIKSCDSKSAESGLDLSLNSTRNLTNLSGKSDNSLPPLAIQEKPPLEHNDEVSKLSKVIYRRLYKKIRRTVFFSCPMCKKTCQKNFNMLAHRALIHPQNGVHKCPSCSFTSLQPREIFDHIRKHCRPSAHNRKRVYTKPSSTRQFYRCWFFANCTKSFSTWSQTMKHMIEIHSQDGNPFDIIKRNQQQLLLTPEQSDEETGPPQPVLNSTPLDFSFAKLKQQQGGRIDEKVNVPQLKTEPLTIEPMSSPDDGCEGALDLSFRSSTQSLHLSGYSSTENDPSRDQSDYQNNNKLESSPWNNLKQISHVQPAQVSQTVMYNQHNTFISDYTADAKSGQFAIRRPKKNSNLSKPQINPDYLQKPSTGIENSFWSSYKNSTSFSSFASECLPSNLAYQGYLPFHTQNSTVNGNHNEFHSNTKSKKSSPTMSDDHSSEQKLNYCDDDEIQMKKLLKKKNSYKDAPKLITCPVPGCLQKFPWHSSLKRHIITHTEHKPYKCTRCHKSFSTKSNRERHMERLHGVSVKKAKRFQVKNNSACPKVEEVLSDSEMNHCGSISSNESDSGLHTSTQHLSSRFLSDSELKEEEILSMDNNDRQAETISTNLLMQAGEPQIEPNPERFSLLTSNRGNQSYKKNALPSQKSSLSPEPPVYFHRNWSPSGLQQPAYRPIESISSELPNCFQRFESSSVDLCTSFKCPFCGINFSNRIKTLEHILHEHVSEWSMLLKKLNARDLQDVLARHHSPPQFPDPLVSDADSPTRGVPCCICLHRFQSYQDLQRHVRSHTGARPFVCPICNKEFSLKHSMQRHLKAHSEGSSDLI